LVVKAKCLQALGLSNEAVLILRLISSEATYEEEETLLRICTLELANCYEILSKPNDALFEIANVLDLYCTRSFSEADLTYLPDLLLKYSLISETVSASIPVRYMYIIENITEVFGIESTPNLTISEAIGKIAKTLERSNIKYNEFVNEFQSKKRTVGSEDGSCKELLQNYITTEPVRHFRELALVLVKNESE
jgi:hypothetical protein